MRRTLFLTAFALAASVDAARAADRFSFWDASLLPDSRAMAEAQAFVAEALPPGLPLAEARQRAEAAKMQCKPAAGGGFLCLYSTPQGAMDGLIGEDAWTLRLLSAPGGALTNADLRRNFIGSSPPNPQ